MYLEFRGNEDEPHWGRNGRVGALAPGEQRILWAVRRLALMRPLGAARCQAVHVALQRDFGDTGLGIEHLLRCWLVGLARHATRRVVLGEPACPMLLPDEARLLLVLRMAASDPDVARGGLEALAGTRGGAALLPLFAGVAQLIRR
ncbi:hypothetical protein [Polymorphobacter fuscus]|uniref:Uncharacterized protein n=1 Tax=Sandarakinorhabdus fusca TaxID=1439888 RepID=A0A7C9KNC9_9SPHN|nr:hypothetical protein [Polymorphobacter fuscus]KAB7646408.1 hypothetical protein F9290_10260 [Polymorphobacter fuscus]MQT17644.1 hypothetical protein [Polymorphobacter fuscus]NJC09811.1 hypothetical protein [Polymorphobacter fuscus]